MSNENGMKEKKKKCKFCGALVPANAQKCRYCGEWLDEKNGKSWLKTMLLSFFLGFLGIHRFYTGYIGIGITQLLTLGGLSIWSTIDFYAIALNKYKDIEGKSLRNYNKTAGIILAVIVSLWLCSVFIKINSGDNRQNTPSIYVEQKQVSRQKQISQSKRVLRQNNVNNTQKPKKSDIEFVEHFSWE